MLKGLGNIAALMKNAQNIGGKMGEIGDELKAKRVSGSAGGGMVTVEANGLGHILSVKLDPVLVEKQDAEMIQDLLPQPSTTRSSNPSSFIWKPCRALQVDCQFQDWMTPSRV